MIRYTFDYPVNAPSGLEVKSDSSSHVLRRKHPLVPPSRYYPYARGKLSSANEEMKEVVVGLGVELSLYVAEAMFLLCDENHTLLAFCFKLWKCATPPSAPVSERLLRVIYHVYSKDIKPKNVAYHDSVPFQLISTTWKDFCDGFIVLRRLVMVLKRKDESFDDRLLSSAIAKYKQVLKSLEDKLRSAKHVSEANGFEREKIESNISHLWKSLFDKEAVDLWTFDEEAAGFDEEAAGFDEEAGEVTPKVIKIRIIRYLFLPVMGNSWHSSANPKTSLGHSEIQRLPVFSSYISPRYSPYILGDDFALEELKEEVVGLGVKLSLHVAESMFLLCDDTRSMINFSVQVCYNEVCQNGTRDSSVMKCLVSVVRYVNSEYIKANIEVCQNGVQSVHWELISTTWKNFVAGIRDLDFLVLMLGRGIRLYGREFTSRVEEALKKVEESLRSVRDVSEANGFARDAMEPKMLELWESVFDKETKEA